MVLAFIGFLGMVLGTCLLAVFRSRVAELLGDWRRERARNFSAAVPGSRRR
jgi:hypothetical protein